jgi:4-amino-4-deoxy-L-arabinose transferase-like glycosyltransferase
VAPLAEAAGRGRALRLWRRRAGTAWPWWAAGLLVVILALGVRLAYVDATPGYPLRHDSRDYDGHARSIAAGEGFSATLAHGRPTAFRPPGYPYMLAGIYRLAGVDRAPVERRVRVARIAGAVLGTLTVALVGLLALALWGRRTAVIAGALTALYVPLITVGATVMSEPLFVVLMLAALLAVVRHRQSAHRLRFALLGGVLAGLAILTRANALVLLLPFALAVWDGRPRLGRAALGPPLALVAVALLTVAPWTVRNAVVLHSFVPVSTQLGSALAGTYNDQARNDPVNPASWRSIKHVAAYASLWRNIDAIPEPEVDRRLRASARRYIVAHPAYVAEVGFWNTVRMLDLAGLRRSRATAATIGIDHRWADAGVVCFWIFAAVALAGAATARARATPRFVWAIPALLIASVIFLTLETPRYRTAVDPFVVLLAALALSAAWGRASASVSRRRRDAARPPA